MKKIFVLVVMTLSLWGSVGEITALKGDVKVLRGDETLLVTKGFEVSQSDTIMTDASSKLQVRFVDGTTITIGKLSTFKIEEYKFDTADNSSIKLKAEQGFFKSVTGKIGELNHDKFKLMTKTSTIGIRGTIFAGAIDPEVEQIACLEGAISVDAGGESIDVNAGEMTVVLPNSAPSSPIEITPETIKNIESSLAKQSALAKIDALALEGAKVQFDKETISSIVADIMQISNDKERSEATTALNDKLYSTFQQALDGVTYKVDVPLAYNVSYNKNDSYDYLTWGFRTFNEVATDNGNSFEVNLAEAFPGQFWLTPNSGADLTSLRTPTTTIDTYAGGTGEFWDGNSDSRTVNVYSGKSLVITDANTVFQTIEGNDYPTDSSLISAIDSTSTNEIYLVIDHGNQIVTGYIKFTMLDPNTNTLKTWYLDLFNSDSAYVSNQKIYFVGTNHIWENSGSDVNMSTADLSSTQIDFRYYGDDANQVAGTFNIYNEDGSISYGESILNNTESVTYSKYQVSNTDTNTNSAIDWGYWVSSTPTSESEADLVAAGVRGGWVKAKSGISQTATSTIDTLLTNGGSYTYTGGVIGSVYNVTQGTTSIMQDGSAILTFDFTNRSVASEITFAADSQNWDITSTSSTLDNTGFTLDTLGSGANHDAGVILEGSGSGSFYGTNAEYVVGGFKANNFDTTTKDISIAVGAIAAAR